MNSFVLGLFTNVLATSLLFATTALVDSALAVEGLEEPEITQEEIVTSLDEATEHTEVANIEGVKVEDLAQSQEAEEKLALNTNTSSELVGQEVSSPEAKAVVVFSDKSASEI